VETVVKFTGGKSSVERTFDFGNGDTLSMCSWMAYFFCAGHLDVHRLAKQGNCNGIRRVGKYACYASFSCVDSQKSACGGNTSYAAEEALDANLRALMATEAMLSMSLFLRAYTTSSASAGWNSGNIRVFSAWNSVEFLRSTKYAFVLFTTMQHASLYCAPWTNVSMIHNLYKSYHRALRKCSTMTTLAVFAHRANISELQAAAILDLLEFDGNMSWTWFIQTLKYCPEWNRDINRLFDKDNKQLGAILQDQDHMMQRQIMAVLTQ